MLAAGVRIALSGVPVAAAVLKLAAPGSSQAALATFGLSRPSTRRAVWGLVVVAELGLAVGVVLGSRSAGYAAAAMFGLFAVVLLGALHRGRAGAPCACFGSQSRVSRAAVVRNLVLTCAFAVVPALPGPEPTPFEWLSLGLAVALLAVLGLGVVVLALAREVGLLRLQIGPQSALEIPEEGPALGAATDLPERLERGGDAEIALAVFSSEGCRICRALEPAIAVFERDPVVALGVFEEQRDADVWRELKIPGSPFALALDLEGTVLAKGTFNTLPQLEGLLATGERRLAEAVGG